MSAHIRTHPVYYNEPKFYWELLIYKQQQRCHLRYISLHKGKKEGANTMCNQIILLVSSGMASCQWLHVSPRGQSWKTELQKNILRACEGRSPITVLEKKNNLQMSAEGRRALTVAGQSSVTTYTTRGDNYTGWVSIACVCSSLSVVPQESLWVCMWNCVCACVCVRWSLQASYCFAAFDAVIQIQIKKKDTKPTNMYSQQLSWIKSWIKLLILRLNK